MTNDVPRSLTFIVEGDLQLSRFPVRVQRAAAAAIHESPDAWEEPMRGPVHLDCEFRVPGTSRNHAAFDADHRVIWHRTRPNIDRLLHDVIESLHRLTVIECQSRIVRVISTKYECTPEAIETSFHGVLVHVREMGDEQP